MRTKKLNFNKYCFHLDFERTTIICTIIVMLVISEIEDIVKEPTFSKNLNKI